MLTRAEAALLAALVALLIVGSPALALHQLVINNPPWDYSQSGYTIKARAGINHAHPDTEKWEAYGDHYGNDPQGGAFDRMVITVAQFMKVNCGPWSFRRQSQAERTNVTQNWAYASWEWEPAGNCSPKRKSQMEGDIYDGGSSFLDHWAMIED